MIPRFASILATVLLVASCGGDDGFSTTPPPQSDPAPKKDDKAAAAADQGVREPKRCVDEKFAKENSEYCSWHKIRAHFLGLGTDPAAGTQPFVRGTIGTVRDPFEPQLVKFVPKIEIPEEDRGAPAEAAVTPEVPTNEPQPVELGETQKFRAQDYKVVLIRWGTSVNKALVQDPEGSTFIVTTDMPLGNNQGRIVDITRYEVKVREANREDVIVLSIEPDILRIQGEDGASDRLFTNTSK